MSVSNPLPLQIVNALKTRLQAISYANGDTFEPAVRLGLAEVDPNDLAIEPLIQLYDDGDEVREPETFAHNPIVELIINVDLQAKRESDVDVTTQLLRFTAALKAALFDISDTTLAGLALDVAQGNRAVSYPESGESFLLVQQQVRVLYLDTYGAP